MTKANAGAVAELCRRLEGLPLAIELAAARVGVLTPAQMLERLPDASEPGSHEAGGGRFELLVSRQRSAPARHRSLRAALDWSYQLLPPELQRFFARLSVFRGGWTATAAEAVCGGDEMFRCSGVQVFRLEPPQHLNTRIPEYPPSALDLLQELVEASLVQAVVTETGETRFFLLETLREFGDEQLSAEERAALRRRHAGYFREFARQARRRHDEGEQAAAVRQMRPEHENFCTALAWGLSDEGDPELTLEAASLLHNHWWTCGRWREPLAYLEAALERTAHQGATELRGYALQTAGLCALALHDLPRARTHLEQAVALWRGRCDRIQSARAELDLTHVLHPSGEYAAVRTLAASAHAVFTEIGSLAEQGWALRQLGCIAEEQGDLPAAECCWEESLACLRAAGDEEAIPMLAHHLGGPMLARGDVVRARALFEEALAICRRFEARISIANHLGNLAEVDEYEGEYDCAAACYAESLALSRGCGSPRRLVWALLDMAGIERRRGNLEAASGYLQEAEPLIEGFEPRLLVGLPGVLRMYEAEVAAARADRETALRHYGHSLAIWRELASPQHVPRCLEGLARLEAGHGQAREAARLLGTAAALRRSIAQPRPPCEQPEMEALVQSLRATLGEEAFEAAWRDGEATTWAQAAALSFGEAFGTAEDTIQLIDASGRSLFPEERRRVTRADLTEREWEQIAPLLPPSEGRRGRPFAEHRCVLNGIRWKLRTGAAWRDIPARYGSWHTCHERYRLWRRNGLWERIEAALGQQATADP